jgi:hypothetical protein
VATDKSAGAQLEQWASLIGTIAAPITVLGALLFYFGYVSSSSEYAYFGINVDTIGLSTQAYIMRSPQTLLVPLLALTLASVGFLALNAAVRRRITSAVTHVADVADASAIQAQRVGHIKRIAQRSRISGLTALAAGFIMLFAYTYMRSWPFYGLATPLLIGIGAAIISYSSHILNLLHRLRGPQKWGAAQDSRSAWSEHDEVRSSLLARRTAGVFVYVMIAASVFWATATIAQWSGRGLAEYAAVHFDALPSVILDTKEQLWLHDPPSIVKVTQLQPSQGQTFHYRYRGLRLLIVGQDRMFLVPAHWSPSDSTLIVPLDGSVRVQFQFENQAP